MANRGMLPKFRPAALPGREALARPTIRPVRARESNPPPPPNLPPRRLVAVDDDAYGDDQTRAREELGHGADGWSSPSHCHEPFQESADSFAPPTPLAEAIDSGPETHLEPKTRVYEENEERAPETLALGAREEGSGPRERPRKNAGHYDTSAYEAHYPGALREERRDGSYPHRSASYEHARPVGQVVHQPPPPQVPAMPHEFSVPNTFGMGAAIPKTVGPYANAAYPMPMPAMAPMAGPSGYVPVQPMLQPAMALPPVWGQRPLARPLTRASGHQLQHTADEPQGSKVGRFAWFVFGAAFGICFAFFATGLMPKLGKKEETATPTPMPMPMPSPTLTAPAAPIAAPSAKPAASASASVAAPTPSASTSVRPSGGRPGRAGTRRVSRDDDAPKADKPAKESGDLLGAGI